MPTLRSLSKVAPLYPLPVIPESAGGRYPWFDRLTTLSEVEGESRENY